MRSEAAPCESCTLTGPSPLSPSSAAVPAIPGTQRPEGQDPALTSRLQLSPGLTSAAACISAVNLHVKDLLMKATI